MRLHASLRQRVPIHFPEMAEPMLLAAVVGFVAGLGALLFKWLLDVSSRWVSGPVFALFAPWGRFQGVLLPAMGGLLAGLLMYYFGHGLKGHSVPEIIESVALHGGRISPQVHLTQACASILTIGSGGSAGRVAPVVQIGAAVGSGLGQLLRLPNQRVRDLVACGAAAGIAVTFNAPIAGVFFALEVVLGELSAGSFSTIVLASVAGSVLNHGFGRDMALFSLPVYYRLDSLWELVAYLGLGALAGLTGVFFIRSMHISESIFDKLPGPDYLKPMLGGLLVGLLGVQLPEVLGMGRAGIEAALFTPQPAAWMLLLLLAKILATALTLGSGGCGGVFAPILFIGSMLGGAYGWGLHQLWPGGIAASGAYALVGMAAVFAATAKAPITAVLILFEMTHNHRLLLPLMVATGISVLIATFFEPESIYTLKLVKRGVDLAALKQVNLMQAIRVDEAMDPAESLIQVETTAPLMEILPFFEEQQCRSLAVVDADGDLYGMVVREDVRGVPVTSYQEPVKNFCSTGVQAVFPDESLEDALRHFVISDLDLIPVVSRQHPSHLVGVLPRSNILNTYAEVSYNVTERRQRMEIQRVQQEAQIHLKSLVLSEGDYAVGRQLREIVLPTGTLIVSIRRGKQMIMPHGDTHLMVGDKLMFIAEPEDETAIRRALVG